LFELADAQTLGTVVVREVAEEEKVLYVWDYVHGSGVENLRGYLQQHPRHTIHEQACYWKAVLQVMQSDRMWAVWKRPCATSTGFNSAGATTIVCLGCGGFVTRSDLVPARALCTGTEGSFIASAANGLPQPAQDPVLFCRSSTLIVVGK
jgi:hypothetical protein